MTTLAAHTNSADPIEVLTVTESTGLLNVFSRIMECPVRPCPRLGMSQVGAMAIFTGIFTKADIETRVAARSAEFAMAGLAGSQVGLGVLAMAGISFTIAITAI